MNTDSIDGYAILFLALSLDAKLAVGDWQVIGNRPPSSSLRARLPAYKEATGPGKFTIVDYSGNRRREATMTEVEQFAYRRVVAPVRFENALKAKLGVTEWLDSYDVLLPADRTSATAFNVVLE